MIRQHNHEEPPVATFGGKTFHNARKRAIIIYFFLPLSQFYSIWCPQLSRWNIHGKSHCHAQNESEALQKILHTHSIRWLTKAQAKHSILRKKYYILRLVWTQSFKILGESTTMLCRWRLGINSSDFEMSKIRYVHLYSKMRLLLRFLQHCGSAWHFCRTVNHPTHLWRFCFCLHASSNEWRDAHSLEGRAAKMMLAGGKYS